MQPKYALGTLLKSNSGSSVMGNVTEINVKHYISDSKHVASITYSVKANDRTYAMLEENAVELTEVVSAKIGACKC